MSEVERPQDDRKLALADAQERLEQVRQQRRTATRAEAEQLIGEEADLLVRIELLRGGVPEQEETGT